VVMWTTYPHNSQLATPLGFSVTADTLTTVGSKYQQESV
jgi:hypothetical protein